MVAVSTETFRRYLQLRGWQEVIADEGSASVFLHSFDDQQLEIPLPKRWTPSADRLIVDGIRTLSQITGQETSDVIDDINSIKFDRIRSILPDELVRFESIHLGVASSFIANARRLIATTATVELQPSAFFGRITKEALAYTESCRFGHTFRGSFGFTIESPIARNDEPSLAVVDQVPPFERRVVQRLVRGLDSIRHAERAKNPGIIAENFRTGFNANMCDA